MAITPERIIKMPAILFTHRRPIMSNFFLNRVTPELRSRNHKLEPVKTPNTRANPEKILTSFANPRAANTAINAKIVKGLVSVRKTI